MSKTFAPLFADAAALEDGTHEVLLDHTDLTEATVDTAQTISLFTATGLKQMVELVRMELITPFEDTTDAASVTNLIEVGDGSDPDRLLTSTQINKNGTEVYIKAGTGTKYVYSADDTVDIVFAAPTSGKNLAAINKGQLRLIFKINDCRQGR